MFIQIYLKPEYNFLKWSDHIINAFRTIINDDALKDVKCLRLKDADESVRDQFMVQSLINKSIKWIKQSFLSWYAFKICVIRIYQFHYTTVCVVAVYKLNSDTWYRYIIQWYASTNSYWLKPKRKLLLSSSCSLAALIIGNVDYLFLEMSICIFFLLMNF